MFKKLKVTPPASAIRRWIGWWALDMLAFNKGLRQ